MTISAKKLSLLTLMLFILITATACVVKTKIQSPSYPVATHIATNEVEKAIMTACLEIGWKAKKIEANIVRATIIVRGKHTIVVDIPFSNSSYKINYVSSINMDDDGKGHIHPNYNKWVDNLARHINQNLALAGY